MFVYKLPNNIVLLIFYKYNMNKSQSFNDINEARGRTQKLLDIKYLSKIL